MHIDKFDIIWHASHAYATSLKGPKALEELGDLYLIGLQVSAWENRPLQMIREFKQSVESLGHESPLVKAGLCESTPEDALRSLDFVEQNNRRHLAWFT